MFFPAGVTDFRGPISTGFNPFNTGTYDPPISATAAANPSSLIVFTPGAVGGDVYQGQFVSPGCATASNTETRTSCDFDILVPNVVAFYARGSDFGGNTTGLGQAWKNTGNTANFSFADTHAKGVPPMSTMINSSLPNIKLDPKYWLVSGGS